MAETGAEAPYAAQVKPNVVNRIAMNARRMSIAFHQRQSTNSKLGVRLHFDSVLAFLLRPS
jgi:hypothetical protein